MTGIGMYSGVNVIFLSCLLYCPVNIHTIFYSSQHSLAKTGNTNKHKSAGRDAALVWALAVLVVIKF